ncbi:MarR family transcriptional regulator [Nocardioides sp. YIM 123512]|uniref:MarR family transcriptional regulator n=2 Tax=Nocardioides flavescens TaxID=2691959 RepID=A0A6L7F0A4_9ACTN|nr:MarR family transcriptional regulator [Nocardioides flavescens]
MEERTDDDAPQWLAPDEQESWLALVSLLVRLESALDTQMRADAGITHFEYGVLSALSETEGRTMRLSDLAVMAEGSLSRLSNVVTRMEKRGLVRRHPDPDDGRYTLATLTDAGWDLVVAAAPGHVREVRRLVFDPLTRTQVGQLTSIARRIVRTIDPADRCLG